MALIPKEQIKIMTYIEFFDKTSIENLCSSLTDVPERLIFLGGNEKLMETYKARYTKLFEEKGYNIEILCKKTSGINLDQAVGILTEIVNMYDDCLFDLNGGDEILSLALGIVFERYKDKNIRMHRINLWNNTVYDCDKDGTTIEKSAPCLTVEQNIEIYGGDVIYGDVNGNDTYIWDITPEFEADIELMWQKCRDNTGYWNICINNLEAAKEVGKTDESGLEITASVNRIKEYLVKNNGKYKNLQGMMNYFLRNKLVTSYACDGITLVVRFKDLQIKKCLTKAGQALEMKTFLLAKKLTEADGTPVYNDVVNGVVIDWDGVVREESVREYDTENEIDVLLMHGMIPVFVSCKNGNFDSEELYKLDTVAKRFGGKYAKRVLVTTAIDHLGEKGRYLRQRASDMGISVIANVQNYSDAEFGKRLKKQWHSNY